MTIRYSTHVIERMREREITDEEISETLTHPLELREMRYGRQGALGSRAADSFLVVIFEKNDEDLIVVTALKVNRNRVKRYGFARIR